jgi:hypothetical protein
MDYHFGRLHPAMEKYVFSIEPSLTYPSAPGYCDGRFPHIVSASRGETPSVVLVVKIGKLMIAADEDPAGI